MKIESIEQIFKEQKFCIIIFLVAFIFIIFVSHPQIFINDEWISANQLAQIDIGHQFIVNEGKYGAYENATPFLYFESHKNLLGYPLFLPLISLPALKLITFLGDSFDYWVITIWTLLVILLAMIIRRWYPDHGNVWGFSYASLLILFAFVVFIVNIIYYVPFYISAPDAPREVAAIIFTNNLLFAGMSVVLFKIVHTIFQDKWFAIFGTLACIGSSSYLIWASSAKDHMLQIFLFSVIIFGVISFLYSGKFRFWILSFYFIGLLAWDRPEMGIPVLISVFVFFCLIVVRNWQNIEKKKNILFLILSPVFTLIGAIPLFINNYLVSGNPFIVTYTIWDSGVGSAGVSGTATPTFGIFSIFSLFITQITPHPDSLMQDLIRIFFLPNNGSIGILTLTPLFLMGILAIPLFYQKIKKNTVKNEIYLLIFLIIITTATLMSCASRFQGLYFDEGILPDMRLLSNIYLPLNLIGLIILSKFFQNREDIFRILEYFFMVLIILLAILILWFFFCLYDGVEFLFVLSQITVSITVFILFSICLSSGILYLHWKGKIDRKYFLVAISFAIALPVIWQIGVIFLISTKVAGAEGYTFWLPLVKKIVYGLYSLML